MKRIFLIPFLLSAALAAKKPQLNPEEVSARIRRELDARGINFNEVLRAAKERHLVQAEARRSGNPARALKAAPTHSAASGPQVNALIEPIFGELMSVYRQLDVLDRQPRLVIDDEPTINAYAADGRQVRIYLALSELVYDSPSELAFPIAHELGHIVQQRTGVLAFVPENEEFDADVWGVLTTLLAGYDPYAGAGTLAKLSMVVGDVGLQQQYENQWGEDAHKSFVTRIEVMYNALQAVCSIDAGFRQLCDDFRSLNHPHFPTRAVL